MHKNFILYLQIKKSIGHFKVRHNEMLNFTEILSKILLYFLNKERKRERDLVHYNTRTILLLKK